MAQLAHLTSPECREYLYAGGDLAVIPVGATERLGPHLPLGARNLVVEIIADLIADRNGGLSIPIASYSTLYDTFKQRGSVDVSPGLMHRYMSYLCDELIRSGFLRIIIVAFPDEFFYLAFEYYQKTKNPVIWMTPDRFYDLPGSVASSLDAHGREFWRFIACLAARGDKKLLDRTLAKTKEYYTAYAPKVHADKAARDLVGRSGYSIPEGEWKFYPVNLGKSIADSGDSFITPSEELIAKAKAELLEWIDGLAESVDAISDYRRFIEISPVKGPI